MVLQQFTPIFREGMLRKDKKFLGGRKLEKLAIQAGQQPLTFITKLNMEENP